MNFPDQITIVDVSARDGLQSFKRAVDTETKVALVDRLSKTGLPVIEVTGFAHPRIVPNLADAEQVCERISRRPGIVYRGLTPNVRGAERAIKTEIDELLGLITASAAYQRKNQNMTLEQGVEEAIKTFQLADNAGKKWVMALGMSMWCAYEGRIPEERVLKMIDMFHNAGMRRFYFAGSLGMEDPRHVSELIGRVLIRYNDVEIGYHVHNLAGMGLANVLAAIDAGATFVEGAVCGIGGGIAMPKTVASVGNLATEDIVNMLNQMGINTGIETAEMVAASRDVARMLGIEANSYISHVDTCADVTASARQTSHDES